MEWSLLTLFSAGVGTFFTPCVLPLVPVYLTAIAGVEGSKSRPSGGVFFLRAVAFALGLVSVFSVLGGAASAVGGLVRAYSHYVNLFGGLMVTIFGLKLLGVVEVPLMDRVARLDDRQFATRFGFLNAFVIGVVFGAGWSPCVGPLLGSALTFAASTANSVSRGVLFLVVYGLGFSTPFLILAAFADRARTSVKKMNQFLPLLETLTGALLLLGGVYLLVSAVGSAPPAVRDAQLPSRLDGFHLPDGLPALVEFYSEGCAVCKGMEPVVNAIFSRCDGNRVTLRKVDLSLPENRHFSADFRIIGVPTFILMDGDHAEVARLIGHQSEDAIYQALYTLRGERCPGVGAVPQQGVPATRGTTCASPGTVGAASSACHGPRHYEA